ncbi:putative PurR-regulated permease PerM [Chitinivorax tropicus]|uniref:Putative PurR-regulated permease PerM n=1 Tax=Chitinivorax tropicus TaxID=714531 RepID=A0A840MM19_9PROT|nr:putative PurR-regulated permease PerM [Chitinivorax tropicus]
MIKDPQHYALSRIVFYLFIAIIFYLLYEILQPFLVPLCWAGVLAVCVYPLHRKLQARMSAKRAALSTTFLVTLLLVLPALGLTAELVRQAYQGISALQNVLGNGNLPALPHVLSQAWDWAQQHLPVPPMSELKAMLNDGMKKAAGFIAGQTAAVASKSALFLLDLLVTLFALYFCLRDAPRLADYVRRLMPFSVERRDRLLSQTRNLIHASVTSSLLVALAQGVLGGTIFFALGIHGALFWGMVMTFLALLPAIGTALVWLPTALWLIATGDLVSGLVLLGLGFGVIGMIDNLLRPILMSGHSEMNELLMFISILGGIAVFGFLGVVLGPVMMATALSLTEAYLEDDEKHREETAPSTDQDVG